MAETYGKKKLIYNGWVSHATSMDESSAKILRWSRLDVRYILTRKETRLTGGNIPNFE